MRLIHLAVSVHGRNIMMIVLSCYMGSSYAVEIKNLEEAQPLEADFNPLFLNGNARSMDTALFKYNNPILAGDYYPDIYVNSQWVGRNKIVFHMLNLDKSASACFEKMQLIEYGVNEAYLLADPQQNQSGGCITLNQWLNEASYTLDTETLRLDLSIPQIAMNKTAQDTVAAHYWDRGIDAGYFSYHAGAYKSLNLNERDQNQSNLFLNAQTGINLLGWQFRHQGQWNWRSGFANTDAQSSYQSISTYIQRAMPAYRGVLSIGDSYTAGDTFDAIPYRGIDFSSEDRMLPSSQLGYAPQIHGYAKSNAKVEIRLHNQLIYQTMVAAGPFEISDLYPVGLGGELEVKVIGSNNDIHIFYVPYHSMPRMLRPGLNRYSIMLGQYRDHLYREKYRQSNPWLTQLKYAQGLNNRLTLYSGLQLTENYTAMLLGTAWGSGIGAFSVDLSHAQTQFAGLASQSGQRYKLSYAQVLSYTSTHFNLAATRYSSEEYYSLRDAMHFSAQQNNPVNHVAIAQQRSEIQLSIHQSLAKGWGSFYATASRVDYWHQTSQKHNYQLGYSNQWGRLSYRLLVNKRYIPSATQGLQRDTEYLLNLSLALQSNDKRSAHINASLSEQYRSLSFNQTLTEQFDYQLALTQQNKANPSLAVQAKYKGQVTSLAAGYYVSDQFHQANMSLSGNVVVHQQGILFGSENAQTMALIYAPHAQGAQVNNSQGLYINKKGYAIVPFMTPYRFNDIQLDPKKMSLQVELEHTRQRVVPYAGAILKLDFATQTGYAIYIKAKQINGLALPFYADVYNAAGTLTATVGQGGLIYLRTPYAQGQLKVHLQEGTCLIDYDLTEQIKIDAEKVLMTTALCH
ncbi:outer membrane usher protein [Acinetobacter calcoaceticus]|uniref:Outer membrane usher protein n=1 Tax=Acinetobacter calcoaceticus TaxID=471 RepID=A0A4V2R003_ACICA|nr:outer membrane usher protein [Acinetobacter calcoaceticus]